MKGKTLLSLAIAVSMILSVLPIMSVKAAGDTTVEVLFENAGHWIEKAPCSNFVVTIKITLDPGEQIDFVGLEIHWDPAVLELQTGTSADVTEGPWMKSFGTTGFVCVAPDNVAGILPDIANGFLTPGVKATGSGDFCYINFHCKAPGDGNIVIWAATNDEYAETYLLDGLTLVPIDVVINGVVHQPAPPPERPDAEFTPDDGALVPVCTDVVLDGSGSEDGWDTLPDPGHVAPIISWKWTVDFHNGTIIELEGEVVSFHCDAPGEVTITLTVNATDPNPPGADFYADGWETNSETHTIMQVAPAVGAAIDVYTSHQTYGKGGLGPLGTYPIGWSDAYGPQEEVCVHAKVTYNDEPVANKPVGFEMINPEGTSVDFRVAFTGEDGIATVCFRIPWEGMDAEDFFGNWAIVGTVDVAGNVVSDTVKFRYGYIISIEAIYVDPVSLHKTETITIDVDLQSISMIARHILLTMVASDNCSVPIGLATDEFDVDPEDGISAGHTITIPSWAFVGTAKIIVNVFTDYPSAGGVPYCPEKTKTFIILKTV